MACWNVCSISSKSKTPHWPIVCNRAAQRKLTINILVPSHEKGTGLRGRAGWERESGKAKAQLHQYSCQATSFKWPSEGKMVQLLGRFPVQKSQWFASQNPSVGPSALHAGTWAEVSRGEGPAEHPEMALALSESQRLLAALVLAHTDLEKGPSLPAGHWNHQVIRQFPFRCTRLLHCGLEGPTFTTGEIYYIKLMT